MADRILTQRDLNRILLARQMLLKREQVTPQAALARLLVLQAQLPKSPFISLWNRIEGFRREDLLDAIHAREIVRSTLMRGTLHLARAEDVLAFRHTIMPPRDMLLPGGVRPAPEVLDRVLDLARVHFAEAPRDFDSIRQVLEREGLEPVRPLAYAARLMLPLVQPNTDGPFGHVPGGEFVMAEAFLGRKADPTLHVADLLRRYLAAHGPATPANFANWSGLQGVAPVFAELEPELVTFKDDRNRTLHDLKDAPRPGGETPAPVRLLPDFDAAVLIKENRGRIVPAEIEPHFSNRNLMVPPMVLVDGFVAGGWKAETKRKVTTVAIRLFGKVSAKDRKALEAEAEALAGFLEPETKPAVSLETAG